jgi:hypothetical protein
MTSNADQEKESKGEAIFAYGCGGILFLSISTILSGAFFVIADNLHNQTPLTFRHLACVGFVMLSGGLGMLLLKILTDPELRKERLFFVMLFFAWIISAFVILYFYKDISFEDFIFILRASP